MYEKPKGDFPNPSVGWVPEGPRPLVNRMHIEMRDDIDDLGARWDPDAARLARVLVSEGRLEIVLCERDSEWVADALGTLADGTPTIVIACPGR